MDQEKNNDLSVNKLRYTFSGHETFFCKSLWLKKGYDFVFENKDFNSSNAVIDLGVGKNMVASIKFWIRAFGLYDENGLTYIANYLFNKDIGKDQYIEDIGTLWLLHYNLIKTDFASIYKLFFVDFHKEKNGDFTKEQLQYFIKRKNGETKFAHLYNENTVKKDINVLFQNYLIPDFGRPNEDYSALLINLNLLKYSEDEENKNRLYYFNSKGKNEIPPDIFLYAIIEDKDQDQIVSFDRLIDLSLIFCLTKNELIDILLILVKQYPESLRFTDDGGIKQLFFLKEIDKTQILENYYNKK